MYSVMEARWQFGVGIVKYERVHNGGVTSSSDCGKSYSLVLERRRRSSIQAGSIA